MVSVFALPDGTIVKLNAGSSLSYTTRFETAATRTVKLTGEALFEVAKDSMRPFIAETDCMSIEALGTVFNVKAYHDENEVVATLVEGSVKVTTPGRSPRILRPNEQLTYNRTARTASIANVNAPLYTLWADNQLYFNNERFDVILHILSRAYGVKITTRSQQLAASHYSGILSRKLDIQALLESLTQSRNFSLSKLEDSNEIEIIENK
jgi:ferric-dicitrate binding protein FerR (iron transport regulator)